MTKAAGAIPAAEELSEKKVELMRIAYRLMAQKGMHRTTLQDVAEAAGLSKATVVYYFRTKEDLVLTTMRWVLGRVAWRIVDATAAAAGREEKFRAMIGAIFVDPQRNRDFYVVYSELIGHTSRNGRFAELNDWFREIMTGQYAQLIRDTNGAAANDVEQAAMVVRALIDGLFLQWLEERDWVATHAAYRELCERSILAFLEPRGGSATLAD
jgi:TetR/AcrR family transcriptional regulator, fatty acid metabolism regulator protein